VFYQYSTTLLSKMKYVWMSLMKHSKQVVHRYTTMQVTYKHFVILKTAPFKAILMTNSQEFLATYYNGK
jgi:hypothetical protein